MHWYCKKLNYDILIPKLDKNIYELTEKEAALYFEWFMAMLPERVAYVSNICTMELGISADKLDCSPESLLLLWRWFLRRANTETVTYTEKNKDYKNFPSRIWKNERKLTLETEYILRDVGMYLGETFRNHNPNLYWTYYTQPRRDFFVNHPLLKGFVERAFGQPFEASFEPIHMAGVQAAKIMNKTAKEVDLFNLYNMWVQKI
jgi:hypothetical protein